MSIELSTPIAAYFAADKQDSAAVAQCFTENAVVTDESGRPRFESMTMASGQIRGAIASTPCLMTGR